jgi:hypothetical protein
MQWLPGSLQGQQFHGRQSDSGRIQHHAHTSPKAFYKEFVAKRFGESKQAFELSLRSQPPFALLLDYTVDEHSAVIVEVNGKRVVTAPSFPASGHYDDSRRIEIPLTLSRFETNDLVTRVVAVGWGLAKVQVVGY